MNTPRRIVIINQAANYLTVGMANAFNEQFDEVILLTGSVHIQGEALSPKVRVHKINRWHDAPAWRKYSSFFLAMLRMWLVLRVKYRKYEVLFVSVPPMAYLLNLILPHRFSMVIWDVYPDLLKVTGMKESHAVYRVWSYLNKKSFQKAHRLITISDVMATSIAKYVRLSKIRVQPIWSIFKAEDRVVSSENPFIATHSLEEKFVVQYSGNIGLTHKVECLVAIANLLPNEPNIHFQIIGRGPRKKAIQKLVETQGLRNCQFLPFQKDEDFANSLSAANLGVVILDETVGLGSVPSKSYNLMALGIPSLYIAPANSQLDIYAKKYKHSVCFSEHQISKIAEWIKEFAGNSTLRTQMSSAALKASSNFTRKNADLMVQAYLNHSQE